MSLVEKATTGVGQADIDESYRRFPGEQGPARYGFLEGIRREREACARIADGWGTVSEGAHVISKGIADEIRARTTLTS